MAGDGAQFDAIILDLQRLRLLGALSEESNCLSQALPEIRTLLINPDWRDRLVKCSGVMTARAVGFIATLSCCHFLPLGLSSVHPVSRLLRLAGGGKDGTRIVLEEAQPGCHVSGMIGSGVMGDTEVSQDK